jgi:glyoxylase-like metal-dependent hydrolase (beta-lactamase superfamily II)
MKNPISLFMAAVLFPFAFARAEDEFTKETFKSTQLAPSIHLLEGAGGNITALIGPEGVFLVDDDFAQMGEKLLAKLRELKGESPRFIVNTHFHYDHSGGNEVFGAKATIISATETRDRLMKEQTLWKKQHPPLARQGWPTLTFDRQLVLHLNGETVRIAHFPHGHTDGDTVVFFQESKVVSMGDLYFAGMYPIFHSEHEGSLQGYLDNIETVLKEIPSDAKIVPGHGPLSTKPDLEKYRTMIQTSIATVKQGIRSGLTLEQIQKNGLPKECEPYSHGYLSTDRWIELLYRSLKK